MIIRLNAFAQDDAVAAQTAAIVASTLPASPAPEVDIWPFVKAGVISGLTVWFLTRFLGGSR